MQSARVEDSPATGRRKRDISSWQEVRVSSSGARAKKRFYKRKSALEAYFTTDASVEEIVQQYGLPEELLLQWAEECLMVHEDGQPWGFRALLPGVKVIDHTPGAAATTPPSGQGAVSAQSPVQAVCPSDSALAENDTEEHKLAEDNTEADKKKEEATSKRPAIKPAISMVPETPPTLNEDAVETISLNVEETGAQQDQVPPVEASAVPAIKDVPAPQEIAEDAVSVMSEPEDEMDPAVAATESEPKRR